MAFQNPDRLMIEPIPLKELAETFPDVGALFDRVKGSIVDDDLLFTFLVKIPRRERDRLQQLMETHEVPPPAPPLDILEKIEALEQNEDPRDVLLREAAQVIWKLRGGYGTVRP